ncbi:MAG: hypothetical protein FWC43_13870 [Planctomycetaceae bacterium]|nr:hypothetical protein [Planctomycetaceae bacterium]
MKGFYKTWLVFRENTEGNSEVTTTSLSIPPTLVCPLPNFNENDEKNKRRFAEEAFPYFPSADPAKKQMFKSNNHRRRHRGAGTNAAVHAPGEEWRNRGRGGKGGGGLA